MNQMIILGILTVIITAGLPASFADDATASELEFAGTLEETLGHFWALEQNLDEANAELALVHATHPISELYDTMSSHLEENPEFDEKLKNTLLELKSKASTNVRRADAQSAINDAKEIIEEARNIVIDNETSSDSAFRAQLINGLLETAKLEYMEAVSDGTIIEMAEFQDGSAFVWRSQQIFEEIRADASNSGEIDNIYREIWSAFDQTVEPTQMTELVDRLILEFEIVSGVESMESGHMKEIFADDSPAITDLVDPSADPDSDTHLDAMDSDAMDSDAMDSDAMDSDAMDSDAMDSDAMDSDAMDSESPSLPLSPLKQLNAGVQPKEIQCKTSMELVFKTSGDPACVKTSSVQELLSRGWIQ